MRVMPADPSIDQKMLKKPDATKDYTLQVVPTTLPGVTPRTTSLTRPPAGHRG